MTAKHRRAKVLRNLKKKHKPYLSPEEHKFITPKKTYVVTASNKEEAFAKAVAKFGHIPDFRNNFLKK